MNGLSIAFFSIHLYMWRELRSLIGVQKWHLNLLKFIIDLREIIQENVYGSLSTHADKRCLYGSDEAFKE